MAADNRGFSGKLADPEFRRERGVKAARSRTSLDHHVEKVVANAPSLTPEQADKLRSLLPPPTEEVDRAAS